MSQRLNNLFLEYIRAKKGGSSHDKFKARRALKLALTEQGYSDHAAETLIDKGTERREGLLRQRRKSFAGHGGGADYLVRYYPVEHVYTTEKYLQSNPQSTVARVLGLSTEEQLKSLVGEPTIPLSVARGRLENRERANLFGDEMSNPLFKTRYDGSPINQSVPVVDIPVERKELTSSLGRWTEKLWKSIQRLFGSPQPWSKEKGWKFDPTEDIEITGRPWRK